MQDLRTLKQRIQAVRNIRKIADAMKMVSTVKYWRLQDALHRSRKLCEELQAFVPPAAILQDAETQEEPPVHLVLAFFPHRGMCGPLTQNLAHAVSTWFPEQDIEEKKIRFAVFGRKGRDVMPENRYPRPPWDGMFSLSTENADEAALQQAARQLGAWVMQGRIHKLEAVAAHFQNLLRQKPERIPLFPLPPDPEDPGVEIELEPDAQRFLEIFIPLYLEAHLRRILMECMVSEHASRMTAMDNASKNAGELIDRFRLEYNKIRQSKITLELMEIISGSEALQ